MAADHELDDEAFAASFLQRVMERNRQPVKDDVLHAVLVTGMFRDQPPPTAIHQPCANCGDDIIVGPDSQRILAEVPTARAVCVACALVVKDRLGLLAELEVRHAGDALPE